MPDKIEKNKILKILKVQKDNEEIYRPISEWKPQPESGAELSSRNECLCPINLAPCIGCALEALPNDTNIVLQEGPLGRETGVWVQVEGESPILSWAQRSGDHTLRVKEPDLVTNPSTYTHIPGKRWEGCPGKLRSHTIVAGICKMGTNDLGLRQPWLTEPQMNTKPLGGGNRHTRLQGMPVTNKQWILVRSQRTHANLDGSKLQQTLQSFGIGVIVPSVKHQNPSNVNEQTTH